MTIFEANNPSINKLTFQLHVALTLHLQVPIRSCLFCQFMPKSHQTTLALTEPTAKSQAMEEEKKKLLHT